MWINVRGEQEHKEGTGFVKSLQKLGNCRVDSQFKNSVLEEYGVFFCDPKQVK